jgi:CheY-like chemotaxis protein
MPVYPGAPTVRRIADVVSAASTPRATRLLRDARVLWVDDRPANNQHERAALERLGIRFDISTSTKDALEKVRSHPYDAIISDMGRPLDPHAGYTLLEELRKANRTIPFIIYAGSNLPEDKALARSKGAVGSTNHPQELFEMVIGAIQADLR